MMDASKVDIDGSELSLQPTIGISWPGCGQDLLRALLDRYVQLANDAAGITDHAPVPFEVSDAMAPQIDGARYIVQTGPYADTVIPLFEEAVQHGTPDTAAGFRQIASTSYTGYLKFRRRWIDSPFARSGLVLKLHLADLMDAPALTLGLAIRHLGPSHTVNEALIDETIKQVPVDGALRSNVGLPPANDDALKTFRHYDEEIFGAISRIKLRREDVFQCFDDILGHPPIEENVIHLQRFASPEWLIDHLKQSREYKMKFGGANGASSPAPSKPAAPAPVAQSAPVEPAKKDGPTVLVHLHIPKTAGTSLNGKLMQGHPVSTRVTAVDDIPNNKLKNMSAEDRANVRVIAGHCVYGLHDLLPNPCLYICVLRKPQERLFSFYRFIQRSTDHPNHAWAIANAPTFGAFLRNIGEMKNLQSEMDNGQVRRISGFMGVAELSQPVFEHAVRHLLAENMVFGLTEHFGDFLHDLATRDLIVDSTEIFANVGTGPSDFQAELAKLSADETDVLKRYTMWDQRLYNIAQSWIGI
ncbi:hypothetical protein [Pseudooctadecabacter sp.]|uniref:hypothetical protein n=1 Tax=Pseudooctadecabacter sp. TaxID=1966338 RepID=UPI003F6BD94E